jgi:hypothetical protein
MKQTGSVPRLALSLLSIRTERLSNLIQTKGEHNVPDPCPYQRRL